MFAIFNRLSIILFIFIMLTTIGLQNIVDLSFFNAYSQKCNMASNEVDPDDPESNCDEGGGGGGGGNCPEGYVHVIDHCELGE